MKTLVSTLAVLFALASCTQHQHQTATADSTANMPEAEIAMSMDEVAQDHGGERLRMAKPKRAADASTEMYRKEEADGSRFNTDEYAPIAENGFATPQSAPLSTFSIDVDHASYTNVRRMLQAGQMPQPDMVRIEEFVNYFDYEYPNPVGEHPFGISTEVSAAPWNPQHQLVHIGLQGKKLDYEQLNPCNLVFLVDVSGSMEDENKLPLLRASLKMLVNELKPTDRLAIVAYAGAAGLVLPSTPVSQKSEIFAALDRLQAGGSTAGGEGIQLAYQVAKQHYLPGGNNRIVLATDGDFNVGVSSTAELVRLVEQKRKEGIFLTVCGFGMGNYKDNRMEQLSANGDGNYYYIDNLNEARKVFVREMRATLFTIAKDVKIQVEFNPAQVQAYRLIGYENRALKSEDFNNDQKDAGELGAGHTVTALYEVIPVGVASNFVKSVDALKYQQQQPVATAKGELLTVKFRYKKPDEAQSKLITQPVKAQNTPLAQTSNNFRFAAGVAEFAMLLRNSEYKGAASYAQVLQLAQGAKGSDPNGYRREFIELVENCKLVAHR